MKNIELKSILMQIKKYGLTSMFKSEEELDNWINSLNQKQIDNFISLNISDINNDYTKEAIFNAGLLDSDFYLSDVTLINNSSYTTPYCLLNLALSDYSRNSEHHKDDMLLIAIPQCKRHRDFDNNDYLSYINHALVEVAMSKKSLNSEHHRKDMLLIATLDTDDSFEIFKSKIDKLVIGATMEAHLASEDHRETMEKVAGVSAEKAYSIYNRKFTDDEILKRLDVDISLDNTVASAILQLESEDGESVANTHYLNGTLIDMKKRSLNYFYNREGQVTEKNN